VGRFSFELVLIRVQLGAIELNGFRLAAVVE